MPDQNGHRRPAGDPWWRFTPKTPARGYFSVAAALICLAFSVWRLLAGGNGTTSTVLFAAIAIVSVLWLVRDVTGLRALLRRRPPAGDGATGRRAGPSR